MLIFSLQDAANLAETSQSPIWQAIRRGRLEAGRTDLGGVVISPSELIRSYPQKKKQPKRSKRAGG
jgi:hypothetical protein